MISTVTCAADLYRSGDTDFISLIGWWVDHYRPPLPLGDYLREQGLDAQGEAADWAYAMRDRKRWAKADRTGPYPLHGLDIWSWNWDGAFSRDNEEVYTQYYADSLPDRAKSAHGIRYESVEDALLGFLDNWRMM